MNCFIEKVNKMTKFILSLKILTISHFGIYCVLYKNKEMISVVKAGKWIAKHRVLILIVSALLMIPSFFGIVNTRVNYDLLSYLPEHLETVKGQDILVDEYGMGAFSMVVVEDMELKDVQKLEEKFSEVPHVKDVLWYDDAADISLPVEMLPKDIREAFSKEKQR